MAFTLAGGPGTETISDMEIKIVAPGFIWVTGLVGLGALFEIWFKRVINGNHP